MNEIEETVQRRIDLREGVMDFPIQDIITRDNVEIQVNANVVVAIRAHCSLQVHPMLLYRIIDPVRSVYEVYDLPEAVEKLVQTTLRSIIGDMGCVMAVARLSNIHIDSFFHSQFG